MNEQSNNLKEEHQEFEEGELEQDIVLPDEEMDMNPSSMNVFGMDWDDSALVEAWDLALNEYNKYYSISEENVEIRRKRKRKAATKGPKDTNIPTNSIDNPKTNLITKEMIDRVIQANSIPLLQPPCNDAVKQYSLESTRDYYNGYRDGFNGSNSKSDSLWYKTGFQAGSFIKQQS
jgi:hypothetical protein